MLAIDARLCLFHPRAYEARVPPEQRTGPSEYRQSGGAFDHEFTQTPLAKHASFSRSLVADRCRFMSCLVGSGTGPGPAIPLMPNVDAWLRRVPVWVRTQDRWMLKRGLKSASP